jgi:hypothetical protein
MTDDSRNLIYLFVAYLTTLSVFSDCTASNVRMVVNNELERIWKGVVAAYFKVLSQNLLGGTEEMCLGIWCAIRYS